MKSTLVLGIGSILRGDDGIGARIIDELKKIGLDRDAAARAADVYGLDLLKYFSDFKKVIIIDAADMNEPPGTVNVFGPDNIKTGSFRDNFSTHGSSLPDTLALARRLDIRAKIVIVGIQPEVTEPALGLSRRIEESIPNAVSKVKSLLQEEA